MKHFLFFQLKNVCYNSYYYFSDALMLELEKEGCKITCFDSSKEPLEHMERFCGMHFDGIFDFNSGLPRVLTDADDYFLDTIDAPFYNIILDDPLYHHDSLKHHLKNYHVLCLDQNHVSYLRKNYPHLRSVRLFPMSGSSAPVPPSMEQRKFDVLFAGTYTPSSDIMDVILRSPEFMRKNMMDLIDSMRADTTQTLADALLDLSVRTGDDMITENFPLHMQAYFPVDSYLRAYYREEVLRQLLEHHIPLTICGHGWDCLPHDDYPSLKFGGSFSFEDTFSIMSRSRILLNVMPWFKAGTHDRIYSSMLNRCVTLTDPSSLLQEQFEDGQNLVFYHLNQLDALPDLITDLLADPAKMNAIAESGYRIAQAYHTWHNRALLLLDILSEDA